MNLWPPYNPPNSNHPWRVRGYHASATARRCADTV